MRIEFETSVTKKDLLDFKLYHNYHSSSGIMTLIFGVVMLAISIVLIAFYSETANVAYILLTMFFGTYFTVYTPVGMYISVNKQVKNAKAFSEPVKYVVTDEKIVLSQGEVTEELGWDEIYRIKNTKKSIVLYLTAVRANVIPFDALKGCGKEFIELADRNLKPFQVKLDRKRINSI